MPIIRTKKSIDSNLSSLGVIQFEVFNCSFGSVAMNSIVSKKNEICKSYYWQEFGDGTEGQMIACSDRVNPLILPIIYANPKGSRISFATQILYAMCCICLVLVERFFVWESWNFSLINLPWNYALVAMAGLLVASFWIFSELRRFLYKKRLGTNSRIIFQS